jgi:hypothetical protein
MIRLFLIGTLFGVMLTATFTYVFALPANNYHWKMEIWKRGGAVWTFDKDGHFGWKWMMDPNPDTPRHEPVIAPPSKANARTEQL